MQSIVYHLIIGYLFIFFLFFLKGDSALVSALNSDIEEDEMPETIPSSVLDQRSNSSLKEDDLLSAFQDLKLQVGLFCH